MTQIALWLKPALCGLFLCLVAACGGGGGGASTAAPLAPTLVTEAGAQPACIAVPDADWNVVAGCKDAARWVARGTVEDESFGFVGWFTPAGSSGAHALPGWTVSEGVTRLEASADGQYVAAMLNDMLRRPPPLMGDRVARVSFRSKLDARKGRLSIGFVGRLGEHGAAEQRDLYLEINLDRTASFDLDPREGIDRYAWYGGGEILYWDVHYLAARGLIGYVREGDLVTVEIPVSKLFAAWPWRFDATKFRLAGVYIGHEIHGRGVAEASISNYALY
jgi:hypothetical protein